MSDNDIDAAPESQGSVPLDPLVRRVLRDRLASIATEQLKPYMKSGLIASKVFYLSRVFYRVLFNFFV
jgi:hypothetical protein